MIGLKKVEINVKKTKKSPILFVIRKILKLSLNPRFLESLLELGRPVGMAAARVRTFGLVFLFAEYCQANPRV